MDTDAGGSIGIDPIGIAFSRLQPSPAAAPTRRVAPQPGGPPRAGAHLFQLDVLRAVAILAVVGFHLYGIVFPGFGDGSRGPLFDYGAYAGNKMFWLFHALRYGGAGVPLFFVLSGFCIQLSHLRSASRPKPRAGGPGGGDGPAGPRFDFAGFVRRRFWRIYPAYAVALTLAVAFAAARGQVPTGRGDLPGLAANLATHAAMLHNLVGDHAFAFNGAFWSLAVEWQFYLAFPLALRLRRRIGPGGLVAVAAGVGVASRIALVAGGAAWDSYLWFLPTVSWVEWCLGVWLADRYVAGRPALSGRGYLLPAALLIACLATGQLVASPLWLRTLWAVFFAAVLERYVRRQPAAPSRLERVLLPVGLSSYSLYLLHLPVLALVTQALRWKLGPHAGRELAVGLLAAVPASVALGWASYKWIELPFARLGRKANPPTAPAESDARIKLIETITPARAAAA